MESRRMGTAAVLLAAIAALTILAETPGHAASLISADSRNHGAVTELRFTLKGSAPRFKLSTHGNQLWIDLDRTRLDIPPRPLFGREYPPVVTVRALSPGPDRSRIVVEVVSKADYAIAQRPNEIVLRLARKGEVANLAAPLLERQRNAPPPSAATASRAPKPAPGGDSRPAASGESVARIAPASVRPPHPEPSTAVANPLPGNPLVMIDPGHGGYDPGTESAGGVLEKDVALQISRRLVYCLMTRGVRARLTRDGDDFISLAERTRRANLANADLFVSIHLNSSPNPQTTGVEVYYLNNTTDRATIRLARMENAIGTGASAPRDSNLNYILADLRQNYKASEAVSLARTIDAQTVADLDTQLGLEVNALGAKQGPFYVLVGAHMPAVLVECGFLSNPNEAARLATAQYQEILAQAIASAVVHYLSSDAAVGTL